MPILELQEIRKSYFLGKEEFPVLKGINLTFDRGDFISLLGESGGGKSTLMNIIGGLDREYSGDVLIDGIAQKSKKASAMDSYRRDTIGFIFQSFNLVNYLSVIDNIMISLKMTTLNDKQRHARAIELTKQMGLYEHRKKKPGQLSGGQKQRVAIARALASDPEIILADEPTGALDSKNTAEVLSILRQIAQSGKTVIVVTHSQEVADYGTRIIHLADGQITGDERIKPAYPVATPEKQFQTKTLSYRDVIRTGFKHFINAWRLNALIALGTAIGLFSVIFFLGLGNGATNYMNSQVSQIANPNMITVMKRTPTNQDPDNDTAMGNAQANLTTDLSAQGLTQGDLDKLKGLGNVNSVQGMYVLVAQVGLTYGDNAARSDRLESWTSIFQPTSLDAGNQPGDNEIVINEADVKSLDPTAYQNKDWNSVIGKTIQVSVAMVSDSGPVGFSENLKISGIMQNAGQASSPIMSDNTMRSMLSAHNIAASPTVAIVEANNSHNVDSIISNIQGIQDNGVKSFATSSIGSMLKTINDITTIVSTVLASIAGISLVVSIFMIVVTTYMSVAERTKEIGVLRALGSRRRDVSRLFTAESIILGISAAVIAIVLAVLGQSIINAALHNLVGGNIVEITPAHIIFAIVIAVIIAFLSSLAPAGRAARLNTIEALAAE